MRDLRGKALAQDLMQQSREESGRAPMEAVIQAAAAHLPVRSVRTAAT